MKQSDASKKFLSLRERALAAGITLKAEERKFSMSDVPNSNGIIYFGKIKHLEAFIRGYELGYATSVQMDIES